MVDVAPIRDEAGYKAALAEVERLWGVEPRTADGDWLDVLMVLVDAYEDEHHRIDLPDPIEAIRIRMDDLGLDRAALARLLGISSGRISEILNRRRRLTVEMMRALAMHLQIWEACLMQPYALVPAGPGSPAPKHRSAAE
jgi:HTH-type transcriptional regulator/antitoxin HigA